MRMIRRSCLLLVVDIEGFASPACDEPVQVVLRQRLYELVEHAVAPSPVEAEAVLQSRELLVFSGTLAGGAGLGLLVGRQRPSIADAMVAQRVAQRFHHADESIPVAQIHAGLARHAAAVDRLARRAEDPKVRAALLRALALTQCWPTLRMSTRRHLARVCGSSPAVTPMLTGRDTMVRMGR